MNIREQLEHSLTVLPTDHMERIEGWGMSSAALSYIYRPINSDGIRAVFEEAQRAKKSVGLRGAGRSYGDAALNSGGVVLDLTRMNRILGWNPDTGLAVVEPGVTIQQLWQYTRRRPSHEHPWEEQLEGRPDRRPRSRI